MILTSGGPNPRWRRKRAKAERLHPVTENASSTTELFDARLHRPGPPAARSEAPPSLPAGATAYEPLPGDPLLRYEWRTATGDVLVVEAAWPARPATEAPTSAAGTNGHAVDGPHVDLRPRAASRPAPA